MGKKSEDAVRELVHKAQKIGTLDFEWVHKTYNGNEFWTEVSLNDIKFQNNHKIVSIIQDITKRKKIEDKLRKSESRYKSMFQNSSSMMLIIDPIDGAIIDANW